MLNNIFSAFNREVKKPRPSTTKPVVLVVMDGYGKAPDSEGNAISKANRPNLLNYTKLFPHGEVIASGESVGLPANEVGNTEVGHLTLGAGRVIDQDLVRINKSIKNFSFYDNKALLDAMDHTRKYNSKLHIAGLVSEGNVHSSLNHFWAVYEFCRKNNLRNVYFHLFTDGRDAPPQSGQSIIEKIHKELIGSGVGKIATVTGRYYAMDRDGRWDRTKLAYDAIVLGRGVAAKDPIEAIKKSYTVGKTDEFVEPVVILGVTGAPVATVNDNDAFFFFNFRIDRPRQLTMAFTLPNFETLKEFDFGIDPEHEGKKAGVVKFVAGTFKREKVVKNLFYVTMTQYQEGLPVSEVAFPKIVVSNPLAEILSKKGLGQMHMAESEKERFVTYYFDGQRESKFPGEQALIVPSQKVATYDLRPEMSAMGIVKEFKRASNEGKYHFFIINFANADMVGHTGNLQAAVKAIEHLDVAVGEIVNWTLALGGSLIITADHGNAEEMLTYPSTSFFITTEKGIVSTDHSNNPVPVIIISGALRGKPNTLPRGTLSDIAPTILHIMGIQKPPEMTGTSLLTTRNTQHL